MIQRAPDFPGHHTDAGEQVEVGVIPSTDVKRRATFGDCNMQARRWEPGGRLGQRLVLESPGFP